MNDNGFHEHCGLRSPGGTATTRWQRPRGRRPSSCGPKAGQAIARQLGYVSRATVYTIVQKALDRHEAEEVERLRFLETARLDRLQASLWGRAMTGDVAAAAQARLIIETRTPPG